MGIGTSKGAFYEDEFDYLRSVWDDKYDENVVTPRDMQTNKQLDKAELDPTTGMGIEVGWKTASPLVNITDEDINTAIDVGMGAGPGTIAGVASRGAKAATGWWKGSDGKMRYEISDEGMKLTKELTEGAQGKLKDFVDHPELYKAYPELGDINFTVTGKDFKYIGGFDSSSKTLAINPDKVAAGKEGILDVITHELQHAIQSKEGFATGITPENALKKALDSLASKIYETPGAEKNALVDLYFNIRNNAQKFAEYMYLRTPGEVEANSVAARRKLTDAQRKQFPVKEMEKMLEGEVNTLHGGKYYPEFNYP